MYFSIFDDVGGNKKLGMTPDEFFYVFVLGNYEDFVQNKSCVRRGFNATVSAFHLADHYYNYCKEHCTDKISDFPERKDYLRYLSGKNPYFQDIQSIANAYKHLYQNNLDAPYVSVSSAGTIQNAETSTFEIEEKVEGVIYRNINTGTTHKLLDALMSINEMWKEELEHF